MKWNKRKRMSISFTSCIMSMLEFEMTWNVSFKFWRSKLVFNLFISSLYCDTFLLFEISSVIIVFVSCFLQVQNRQKHSELKLPAKPILGQLDKWSKQVDDLLLDLNQVLFWFSMLNLILFKGPAYKGFFFKWFVAQIVSFHRVYCLQYIVLCFCPCVFVPLQCGKCG